MSCVHTAALGIWRFLTCDVLPPEPPRALDVPSTTAHPSKSSPTSTAVAETPPTAAKPAAVPYRMEALEEIRLSPATEEAAAAPATEEAAAPATATEEVATAPATEVAAAAEVSASDADESPPPPLQADKALNGSDSGSEEDEDKSDVVDDNGPEAVRYDFVCRTCGDVFPDKRRLRGHERMAHGSVVSDCAFIKTNVCPACKKSFNSVKGARDHFQNRNCEESKTFVVPHVSPKRAPSSSAKAQARPHTILELLGGR